MFSTTEHKKNFLKIKQMVLIGGPQDGVITPWQSRYSLLTVQIMLCYWSQCSIFGFYNENNDSTVLKMENQKEVNRVLLHINTILLHTTIRCTRRIHLV